MAYGTINADVIGTSVTGSSIGPGNATRFKSRIINGDMRIDQRNAGASVTPTNGQYTLDRWFCSLSQASKYTVQQNAGSITPPVGFKNYIGVTSSSAYSISSGDYFNIAQAIEGLNVSDLAWGTVSAKTVTLSFQVYSSLTGTFGGALRNADASRSYPFSFTISSANTWTSISITISGDTTGTWLTTNGVGVFVHFNLGTGSTYSGSAGAWASSNYVSCTGATSVVGTSGATFYLTGVQFEIGSSATGFEYVDITTQYALCQRYYYKQYNGQNYIRFGNGFTSTSSLAFETIQHPVIMRTAPSSVTTTGNLCIWSGGGSLYAISAIAIEAVSTSTTSTCLQCTVSGAPSLAAFQLMANNDGTATIALSAEL